MGFFGGGSAAVAPPILNRIQNGLVFVERFGGPTNEGIGYTFADSPGGTPWVSLLGAWSINSSGQLTHDQSGYAAIVLDIGPFGGGVVECGFVGATSVYHGPMVLVSPKAADFTAAAFLGSLLTDGNQQVDYKSAAQASTTEAAAVHNAMVVGQEYRVKHIFAQNRLVRDVAQNAVWLDRASSGLIGPPSPTYSQGFVDRGLVGLHSYGGAAKFTYFAFYTGRFISAWGLTGTQSLAVVNSAGTVLASGNLNSGANHGRVTIDTTSFDCPARAHYQIFTTSANTAAVANGRYPASGELDDICGGDRLIITP